MASNDTYILDVAGNINVSGSLYQTGASYLGGNVGIGTTTPQYKLDVVGDIRASGDIGAFSDMRLKCKLEKIDGALNRITQLSGYTFNKIDAPDSKRLAGLIAQDVEKVLPEVVMQDDNGYLAISYGNMAGLFVEAFKEINTTLSEVKSEIEQLKYIATTYYDKVSI